MFDFGILFPAVLNGLTTGAVYALVALGLTLIYGVLHIINFAHGAALMMALYGVYFLKQWLGLDPYLALVPMAAVMFVGGYAIQRVVVNRASHGKGIGNSVGLRIASCAAAIAPSRIERPQLSPPALILDSTADL